MFMWSVSLSTSMMFESLLEIKKEIESRLHCIETTTTVSPYFVDCLIPVMRTFFTITNNSIVILSTFLSFHLLLILIQLLLLFLLLKFTMLSVWSLMIYLNLLDLLNLLEGYSCSTNRTWTLRLKKLRKIAHKSFI